MQRRRGSRTSTSTTSQVSRSGRTKNRAQSDWGPADTPVVEKEAAWPKGSGVVKISFMWRVRGDKDAVGLERRSKSPVTEATAKINETITANDTPRAGELYAKAYKCTKKDVLKCHPYLTGNDPQKGRSDIESLGNSLPMRVERSADQSKGDKEAERGETSSK